MSLIRKNKLVEKLHKYMNDLPPSAAQKTQEWYDIKKKTIGGSEIAILLGVSSFSDVEKLLNEKRGFVPQFSGNSYTRWGNLFEPITKDYTEQIVSCEIEEYGSLQGAFDRQRYSPDGIGIVKAKCVDGTYEYFIVLFEFKAPSGSLPEGKIPEQYIPQVQTGLLSIPICDFAIFVNNCYRKCSLADLSINNFTTTTSTNGYDTKYHNGDIKKRKAHLLNAPYAIGIIFFYTKNAVINEFTGQRCDEPSMIDYGNVDINVMLKQFDDKLITPYYCKILLTDTNKLSYVKMHSLEQKMSNSKACIDEYIERNTREFLSYCTTNKVHTVGFMPYKLLLSDVIIEKPDTQWKQKIETPIKNFLARLDEKITYDFACEGSFSGDVVEDLYE